MVLNPPNNTCNEEGPASDFPFLLFVLPISTTRNEKILSEAQTPVLFSSFRSFRQLREEMALPVTIFVCLLTIHSGYLQQKPKV